MPVAKFLNKGVFGAKLASLLNETHSIAPENKCHCFDNFNCCDCGGNDCGCAYCFSCNACDKCLNRENNLSDKLGIQKKDGTLDAPMTYEDWILLQNKVDKPNFSGILAVWIKKPLNQSLSQSIVIAGNLKRSKVAGNMELIFLHFPLAILKSLRYSAMRLKYWSGARVDFYLNFIGQIWSREIDMLLYKKLIWLSKFSWYLSRMDNKTKLDKINARIAWMEDASSNNPEALYCDGERSREDVDAEFRALYRERNHLENLLLNR